MTNGSKEGLILFATVAESLTERNLGSFPVHELFISSYYSSNSLVRSFRGTATQYILGQTFGLLYPRVSQALLTWTTHFGISQFFFRKLRIQDLTYESRQAIPETEFGSSNRLQILPITCMRLCLTSYRLYSQVEDKD